MASPGSSGQNTPKRRLRRRIRQGMSSTIYYQPNSDTSGGVMTKQSKNERQDKNIDHQMRIYQYLNGLPQSQRYVPRMMGHGQMPVAEGGRRYLSMQSQDPNTVKDLIDWLNSEGRQPTISPDTVIQIGNGVLDAVHFLHRHNVAHGDIKPENMIVDSRNRLKLIDFAFSMIRPDSGGGAQTQQHGSSKLRGTRSFMPPELQTKRQIRFPDIHAYDLWATGITLLLIVLMYLYKIHDRNGIRQVSNILQQHLEGKQTPYLTEDQKTWVDALFGRMFPRYDLNLFDRNPDDRYLRPRRQRQQLQQKQT